VSEQWPRFCATPEKLKVDPVCPTCAAGEPWWIMAQPLGEVAGMHDPNHLGKGATGGYRLGTGVLMWCRRCGCQVEYRAPYPTKTPLAVPDVGTI